MYRLIDLKTKEETICTKIELKGFDYYISDNHAVSGDFALYAGHITKKIVNTEWTTGDKKVIATNNSNIDIPQVIDELEYNYYLELEARREVAKNFKGQIAGRHPDAFNNSEIHFMVRGYLEGYYKAKETYQYSEKDMVEYSKWYFKEVYNNSLDYISKTAEELLELWNNQRLVTIYYE